MEYEFRPKVAFVAIALSLVVLFATQGVRADELYGRIRGTVTDPSGAVVSGAKVRVTNTQTAAVKEQATDQNGAYEFINLPIGTYTINVSKQGFRSSVVDNIVLTQNQVYLNNVKMELGSITEEVTITANAAQVEQTSIQLT